MIYPIVIYGDEALRKRCEEITPDYPDVKKLAEDMFLTLEEAEGVGLAAPQIGKNIRLFIVDCTPWGEEDPSCADYKRAFIISIWYLVHKMRLIRNSTRTVRPVVSVIWNMHTARMAVWQF